MRSEMSSTLFNRGMTTQMGQRRRAEEIQRSINELRATASDTHALHEENVALRATISALEVRLASLEKGDVAAVAVAKPDAVTTLQESLVALTRRIDDTILSLQGRLTAVEAGVVRTTDRVQALETNTTMAESVASLHTKIETINSNTVVTDTISFLRTQVASLETRIAGLEAKDTTSA